MKKNHKFFVLGTDHHDVNIAPTLQKMKEECDQRGVRLAVCFEGDFTFSDIVTRRIESVDDAGPDFLKKSNLGVFIQEKLRRENRGEELKIFLSGEKEAQKLIPEKVLLESALSGMGAVKIFLDKIYYNLPKNSKEHMSEIYRDIASIAQMALCKANKIEYRGLETKIEIARIADQITQEGGKEAIYESSPSVERDRIKNMTEKSLQFSETQDDVPTVFVIVSWSCSYKPFGYFFIAHNCRC